MSSRRKLNQIGALGAAVWRAKATPADHSGALPGFADLGGGFGFGVEVVSGFSFVQFVFIGHLLQTGLSHTRIPSVWEGGVASFRQSISAFSEGSAIRAYLRLQIVNMGLGCFASVHCWMHVDILVSMSYCSPLISTFFEPPSTQKKPAC